MTRFSDVRPTGLHRRALLLGAAASGALGLSALAAARAQADDRSWTEFRRRFVIDGARVIDVGNKGVSHSEGQGWGMLFAEAAGDRATFERLWEWTQASLRRPDGLFAWRFTPGTANPVSDKNNASDGDLLIAWALARAARRWSESRWTAQSGFITAAVLTYMTAMVAGRLVLLPGLEGFRRGNDAIVNLSYYVWPALEEFARSTSDPRWKRLTEDGLTMLDQASFGPLHLPPDWLQVGPAGQSIAEGWPPQFGYEAVRIPLYLAWNGQRPRLQRFVTAWKQVQVGGRPAAFIDLKSGALPDYAANGGYQAVFELAQQVSAGTHAPLPATGLTDEDDYYSASLKMLSAIAARETPSPR